MNYLVEYFVIGILERLSPYLSCRDRLPIIKKKKKKKMQSHI